MTVRKLFTNEEIQKIGLRMKSCRVLTNLNQEEFADEHQIPYTTIRNWEYGRVVPRLSGVNDFVESLKKNNVYVNSDWILYGEGYGPSFFSSQQGEIVLSKPEISDIDNFKDECRKSKKIPIISQIDNDSMAPWFVKGDIVAGILVNPEQIDEELEKSQQTNTYPLLVRVQNGKYVPRWAKRLNGEWVFFSNEKFMEQYNSISIAIILYHQWVFPRN